LDLSTIPVIDHHCHPWLRMSAPFDAATYRRLFTEGVDPAIGEGIPDTIYYRWTLRELSRMLNCAPTEEAVLARRAELGHDAVAARLMAEAMVEAAILDHLYVGRGADNFTVAEMGQRLGGATAVGALRLEIVLQNLIVEATDLGDLEGRFRARLDRSRLTAEGFVALKSIVAYRTGLAIERPQLHDVRAAFERLHAEARSQGSVRIAEKALLDYFLLIALNWCAAERFPIQFHTGFGDPDTDLRLGNPLHLRNVLQDPHYREAPLVLLHAAYPFVRELSYLASVYPNVYLDLGLTIPFVATEFEPVIRQALALAPASRVLWSSDGFTIPEHCWFAAVQGRRALARVLDELVEHGALGREDAWQIAQQILRLNARRLYGLGDACWPTRRRSSRSRRPR
jgi:hypothetical protein